MDSSGTHSSQKKDSVDRLKSKLYSRTDNPSISSDIRTPMTIEDDPLPTQWEPETTPQQEEDATRPPIAQLLENIEAEKRSRKMPLVAKFFIASLVFFLCAAGVAAYFFFGGGNVISPKNVDIQLVAPSLVNGGKVSTIETIITNRNKAALKNVAITVVFPEGARSASSSEPLQRDRQVIGEILSGAQAKRSSQAVFYGQQGERERVVVTLEYGIEGSTATFQKQEEVEFIVGSSPVAVMVDMPKEAISGQPFTINLTVQASGATPVEDVALEAQYPSGFSFVSSTPAATRAGGLWQLGTVKPGDIKRISIKGTLGGQDGDEKVFHFSSGTLEDPTDAHITIPFLTVPSTLTLHQPFMASTISLNGQQGASSVAVASGDLVQGVINYKNTLTTPVANAVFTLTLKGAAFDESSVNGLGGFYQSNDRTITWDAQNTPVLAYLAPGSSGTLQFSFRTKETNTNPAVDLALAVSGVRTGSVDVPESIASAATARATIASTVQLGVQSLHFSGPFTNGGPMPPAPGQKTSYTVVWSVKNSSNSVANAKVTASLPNYVEWQEASAGSGIKYDAPNRLVTWDLGDVAAGAGVSAPIRQGAFRVILTPSNTQVGKSPSLTGPTTFTGTDRFAKTPLKATIDAPTTALTGDTGFTEGMGVVAR